MFGTSPPLFHIIALHLCVYDFLIYNFRYTITDIVHLLYPQHLVILFKFFGYIFFFGNFFYQLKEHIVRLFIISAICELSLPLVSRL